MKKHLIAAAVAGAFAVPVMAQVTVSGAIDVSALRSSTFTAGPTAAAAGNSTKIEQAGMDSGWTTSVLRFTATEDLGGGLKVTGIISSLFAAGQTVGQRERLIRLDGGFGRVEFGQFGNTINGYNAYAWSGTNATAGNVDVGGFDFIVGTLGTTPTRAAASGLTATANAVGTYEFQGNMIEYTTPVIGGFSASLGLGKNTRDNDGTNFENKANTSQETVRVNYSAGPLNVSAAHGKRRTDVEGTAAAKTQAKGSITWVGASYNFGPAFLSFAHGDRTDKSSTGADALATFSDVKVNSVALRIPLGATTLHASTYQGTDKRTATVADDDRDLKGYQIGAQYALSKRTFVYAAMGQNENKIKTGANTNNAKLKGHSLGISHSF